MEYKVLLPTAGTGSRLRELCKYLNKSLVSVANKPTISYIIEKFPEEVPIVVALGYRGELVKEYLSLTYPHRQFEYSYVTPFEGPGSGLGLTIIKCKHFLQCPFIFISCDTIVSESIPNPHSNWMGWSYSDKSGEFRTIRIEDNKVIEIREKNKISSDTHVYIGLAGIKDYEIFWDSMGNGYSHGAIEIGEVFGIRALIENGVIPYKFKWFDTGNLETLTKTRNAFKKQNAPNILEKPNEAIWFVNGTIVKYSNDIQFVRNRVKRAKFIDGFCPKIIGVTTHMYKYKEITGDVLSRIVSLPLFDKLLDFSQKFWLVSKLSKEKKRYYSKLCMSFYKEKTKERIDRFFKTFKKEDAVEIINGIEIPKISEMLASIDWKWLTDGLFGRYHGDYHMENIIYNHNKDSFCLLDWRQDFCGSIDIGDIYYDFAKINHGLIMSHEIVTNNLYSIDEKNDKITFDFNRKHMLVECEKKFKHFINSENHDYRKVETLTSLIFLNIAALHHYPYSLLLYYLGKSYLYKIIKQL